MLRHSAKKQLFKIGNLPKVKQINLKRSNCEKPQLDFENLSNLTWLSSTSHKLYMSRSKRYALKNVFAKLCDCRLWRLMKSWLSQQIIPNLKVKFAKDEGNYVRPLSSRAIYEFFIKTIKTCWSINSLSYQNYRKCHALFLIAGISAISLRFLLMSEL